MRRHLKIAGWAVAGLLMLVLLSVGALIFIGNTEAGRRAIESLTYRLTDGQVKLSGLSGSFPNHLKLDELQLRDSVGIWLIADQIAVDWTPLAYLERRLQVDNLQAAKVDMRRLPQSSPGPSSDVSIPRIDVAHATIDLVQLGPELAGAPASLVVRGSAHLRSVRDMTFDASAHRLDGDGTYLLQLSFDPKHMNAALTLQEPAGGPLENILGVPGLGALDATMNLNGPRSGAQLALSLKAGVLNGDIHGTLDLDELSADVEFSADSTAMSPRADLAWGQLDLRGHWQGAFKSPKAQAHLKVSRLHIPGAIQIGSAEADLASDSGKADLHALIAGLRLPGQPSHFLEDDPLKIDASTRLDDPTRRVDLTASHKLFSLSAHAVTAGKQSTTLQLRLPDLAPLGAYAGQTLRGSASVTALLDNYPQAPHLKLDASAALAPGGPFWAGALGDHAKLQLSASFKDQSFIIESAKVSGQAASLSADGVVGNRNIKGRWVLDVTDLSALSSILAGSLKASGLLEGPVTALGASAQINSTMSVRGSATGELAAQIKLRDLPSAAFGTIAAQGSFDGAPLQLAVEVEHSSAGWLHAIIQQANWKSARIDGDISLATADSQTHGQINVAVGQLSDLRNLLGIDIAGNVDGSITMQPEKQRTRLLLQLDGKDVELSSLKGSVQANAVGFFDSLHFNTHIQVPNLRGSPASLAAKGTLNLAASDVSLASAVFNYQHQDIHLLAPARVDFSSGLVLDSFKLGAQKAEFTVQGEVAPQLSLKATLRQVQPALVNKFVPNLLASGLIEGHAELEGSASLPRGEITLDATDIRMADDAALGLPAAELHLNAQLKEDTADLDVSLAAGSASQFRATGAIPLAESGAMDLKMKGNLDVGMLNPFLEARGLRASGKIDIDATASGTLAAPQIGGSMDLSKGSLRDYVHGVGFSDIAAQIVGSGGLLEIKSFTASAAPGTVSMSGSFGVLQDGFPLDLKITARNAQPIVSKLVTSNLDADLRLSGTLRERLDLVGSVQLNRTVIGIPNGLPPNVAVLDVRRRGVTAVPVPDKPLIIGLDVSVKAPQEILVQGRGLDAEMGGELHFGGTTDVPLVSGGFDLERGSFSFASSKLNFTAGRVGFNGLGLKNKIDPTLDFTAQATVAIGTTVSMHITGVADAPLFEFTSTPAMPQDEIMGYLLFGENIALLSPIQMAQIGVALASLSGVGGDGGLNPLVKIQKSLGLDRLSFGAGTTTTTATGTENSGASIEAGRYVSKRIYIEAKQTTAGTSQVGAVVDLTKRLKLQTRLGNGTASIQGTTPENDPGSSIGLIYQLEY
jgi:translocation and assembly module TamB